MRVVHIFTSGIFPTTGGLEASVLRVAHSLTRTSSRVVVYTRKQPSEHTGPHEAHGELAIVHLAQEKPFLMEPLPGDASEAFRLDYLLLLEAVKERMDTAPGASHVLISFFASNNGFVAQHVALTLGIPHIASVQGSDFSRDFRSPYAVPAIQFVVERADLVVTTNREQARVLKAAFPAARAFRTIHNAMPEEVSGEPWTSPPSPPVRLAADCQFAYKKATHVLLRAVAQLLEEGADLTLTVAGGVQFAERIYWEQCKLDYAARFPNVFFFPGWQSDEQLNALFLASHVYVSASLGEGCSLSSMRVLTLGVPMVATHCGALPEFAARANHVRLCPVGSVSAFAAELRAMVDGICRGAVAVDLELVREWRKHFSHERELEQWEEALAAV